MATSSSMAPADVSRSHDSSKRAATRGRAGRRSTAAGCRSAGRCLSARVGATGFETPRSTPIEQRRILDGTAQRPDVIERRCSAGTTPSIGNLADRRLQTDEPARRRRNADRAAGVGADRCVAPSRPAPMPPIRRTSRPASECRSSGWGRDRTPSLRWSCRARTRAGWSCRRRPRRPRGAVPMSDRVTSRDVSVAHARDAAVVGVPADVDEILERDRNAVQRSAVVAALRSPDRPALACASASSASTVMNALSDRIAFGDARQAASVAASAVTPSISIGGQDRPPCVAQRTCSDVRPARSVASRFQSAARSSAVERERVSSSGRRAGSCRRSASCSDCSSQACRGSTESTYLIHMRRTKIIATLGPASASDTAFAS